MPEDYKKRLTIGFAAIADFRSIIGQEYLAGINKACEDFNINIVYFVGAIKYSLADDIDFFSHYKKKLKYINPKNIDGIISWASSFQAIIPGKEIEDIHYNFKPLPIVSIGMKMNDIPNISLNNKDGVSKAIKHLIEKHRYKKIGFIGCKGRRQYEDRFNIYKETLESYNLPYNPDFTIMLDDLNRKAVKQGINELTNRRKISVKNDIDAVFTVSDIIARDFIEELENINIRVPEDIAVVGFNNQIDSVKCSPSITTVDPHFFNFGYKAVETLYALINNEKVEESILMPCDLVTRQSCGCVEDLIMNAEIKHKHITKGKKPFEIFIKEEFENIVVSMNNALRRFDSNFTKENTQELLNCLIDDITDISANKFLNSLKRLFFNFKNISEEKQIVWQSVISEIRNILLPYLMTNSKVLPKAENIFHQCRVMIDVANSYFFFSKRGDVYKLGALARIAADFATVADLDKIIDLIKLHLNELEINGIYLVIFDEIKTDISSGKLILAYQKTGEFMIYDVIKNVQIGSLISRMILPDDKRYSFVFELLFYKDIFLGYVIFEIGPLNIPLYDTFRTILSPSLYATMLLKEKIEAVKEKEILLKNEKIRKILNRDNSQMSDIELKSLSAYKILDYLSSHINEPTSLDSIAKELNIAKSSLVRKSKILTGYSIQKLH